MRTFFSGQSLSKPFWQYYKNTSRFQIRALNNLENKLSLNLTLTLSFESSVDFVCSSLTVPTEKANARSPWTFCSWIHSVIVSHLVPVLRTLSGIPNYSIMGSSSILRILDHCYPLNIWYLDFCKKLSFSVLLAAFFHKNLLAKFTCNLQFLWIMRNSKQRLKGNSVLEIFVKKFLLSKNTCRLWIQFVIFNLWKVRWNWIAYSQNSFVMSPGL